MRYCVLDIRSGRRRSAISSMRCDGLIHRHFLHGECSVVCLASVGTLILEYPSAATAFVNKCLEADFSGSITDPLLVEVSV